MLKVFILILMLSINLTSFAEARVGQTVNDFGALPAEFEMEPYPETLNTTRYAPWYLMYHMWSEKEQEMGRRAGEGGQIVMTLRIPALTILDRIKSIKR